MGIPKRHHYVPEVILKRFTDEGDWLHLFSKRDKRTRRTRIRNAFCEGHLYSEELADGSKDPRVEHDLSWLEGVIEPILSKLELAGRTGVNPNLTAIEILTWRFFFVVQWKRVPDLHKTVATNEESTAVLNEILNEMSVEFPDRYAEICAFREPVAIRRTVRNARISGVAEVSDCVMNAISSRGIAVLAITAPTKALIIGSRPVVQLGFREGLKLVDEATEMWLPISSKIAVGLGPRNQREIVYFLSDHVAIRHFNLAIARQSTEFASHSALLTNSVAKAT